MFQKNNLAATLYFVVFLITNCQNAGMSSEKEASNARLAAIAQTINLEAAIASKFLLNGTWNSFTGNGTTSDTILTIAAQSGSNGVILTDSSGFGGYSSCNIVVSFDNSAGYYIAQNPENNGACFTGDTNKGLYFKTVFFAEGSNYWTCTINATGVSTVASAIAITDNTTRTSPGTSGCSGFSWSRLEKR